MKTFHFKFPHFPKISCQNLAIGKFDGIHKGHELLLNKPNTSVLTFHPLPHIFFKKTNEFIYTQQEKEKIFQKFGIENILFLTFNQTLANSSCNDFLNEIKKITNQITVGTDFLFGKNQSCNIQDIQKFGISTQTIPPIQNINSNEKISTSNLKEIIKSGNFSQYHHISNIPFHLTNTIFHGEKIASTKFNTPTINMIFPENKITPPYGVYATTTEINNTIYPSISNFGTKPTIETTNSTPILETHIFNFNQDIYNMEAKISFLHQIRQEKKFNDINQLHFQIMQDIKQCKKIHKIL